VAYGIYRSERAGKDYSLVGSASEDEFIDVNVEEGRSYFYMLTALDSGFQESRYSAEQAVTIAKAKAPAGFSEPGAEPTVPRVHSE
jgi:fibronectin type 3 domain-containing protein